MRRCLAKLNAQLREFNTKDVIEAAAAYRSRGVEDRAANLQAIDDHLRELRQQKKALEQTILAEWEKRDPEGYAKALPLELKGETESEIRTREATQAKADEAKSKRDNAPSEKGFTLTGSDRNADVAEAHGQKPMFARAPTFYSELSRQIEATKSDSMPGPQWKAYIANLTQKGVKAQEVEWSGVLEWLDLMSANSTVSEGRSDRVARNPQRLRDLTMTPPFSTQGFPGLDVPGKTAVLKEVFAAAQNNEIREAVVRRIPVDVMNVLRARQLTPESLFDDETVFLNLFPVTPNKNVPITSDVATAMIKAAADQAAKVVRESADVGRPLVGRGTTNNAVDDSHALIIPRNRKVSKAEILAFLAQNGVKVEETMLGKNEQSADKLRQERDDLVVKLDAKGYSVESDFDTGLLSNVRKRSTRAPIDYWAQGGPHEIDDFNQPLSSLPSGIRAMVDRIVALEQDIDVNHANEGTKFSQYTLPGGENYRELLLTLPYSGRGGNNAEVKIINERLADDGYDPLDSEQVAAFKAGKNEAFDMLDDLEARVGIRIAGIRDGLSQNERGTFRSSHFDQPNILAHVRFDERTDKDGKRVLFIEEIQSDWAQKGKREGFSSKPYAFYPDKLREGELSWTYTWPSGRTSEVGKGVEATRDGAVKYMERMANVYAKDEARTVPSAPFVGKTEAWVALAVKRMIRYAAENGFDRVAFTTGEQQADRYDLSKHIDQLQYLESRDDARAGEDARGTLIARRDGGLIFERAIPEKDLADHIGKDAAEKLLRQPVRDIIVGPRRNGVHGMGRELAGLDLRVGGEGMRTFYDKIIPNVVNDVLKKLGGGRVGEVKLPTDISGSLHDRARPERVVQDREGRNGWYLELADGEIIGTWVSKADAEGALKKQQAQFDAGLPMMSQPGFDITPAMREKVMGGVPLFNRADAKPTGIPVATLRDKLEPIVAGWANGPDLQVLATFDDAPTAVKMENKSQLAQGADGKPYAFFHEGTAYVIADEVVSMEQAVEGLYHEALGHYGMRGVFGAKLEPMLTQIVIGRREEVAAKAKAYGLDMGKKQDRLTAAEEILAEMAQTRPELGLVTRTVAAIRNFLREQGINIKWSDADIIQKFILPARRFVERGDSKSGMSTRGATFARDDAVQALNDAMATQEKDERYKDAYLPAVLDNPELGQVFRATFGVTVVPVRPRTREFNTFLGMQYRGRIYVNVENGRHGFIPLAGHELLHAIRRDQPGIYDWFAAQATNYFSKAAIERYGKRLKAAGAADDVDVREELLADFVGDSLNDPAFLQHLAERNGSKFKQFVDFVLDWLRGVTGQLTEAGFGSSQYFSDVRGLQGYLGGVLEAYQQQNDPDAIADVEPVQFARSTPLIEDAPQPKKPKAGKLDLEGGESGSRASWDAPEPSKVADVLHSLQDRHVDTKDVLKAIRGAGQKIADTWDVYLQEELYHGRAAKRTQDFIDHELKPLVTEMAARKVEMAEFEKYLHARHAEEANKHIAARNEDMPDGGSGMTTADAKKYLAGLDDAKKRALESLAGRIDKITTQTRETLVSYGLESGTTIKAWGEQFKHYVPLQRADMGHGPGNGQGFSVRGPASKSRTGSKRQVVDILANIAMQRERAITRGEKNRVANALYGLAQLNPNPEFWKTDDPPMVKSVGKDGQVTSHVDPLYKSRENVVMTRMPDGKGGIAEHSVVFNDRDERALRMAKALKNLDMDSLGHLLGTAAKITRYFASVNTQYNPVFGVVNLTRDVQGAMFNLSSTEIAGKQAEVAKHTLSALRGIYIDIRSERKGEPATSSWAHLFEEFKAQGGQTGYRDMFADSKERAKSLEREIKRASEGKAMGSARAVFDWLSDYNSTMENAVRLAAYKVAIDSGMTKPRAASLAKNLTVNFNRKGQIATQAGSLYAFFNASVQGTARLTETLAGPKGRQIILGGILLGAAQAALLAAAGFDDDEPPEFVRQRALIIPIGGKKYITIPMPLGLHVIPNIGRIGTQFALGGFKDKGKHATNLIGVFADSFNPVGSAGFSLQTLSPTALDPLVALAENRDWTGKPIARKDFSASDPSPGHTRAKDTASKFSKWTSQALNWASGGTAYKPGAFSPTPDQIDYLIAQATGGVGREVMKVEQAAGSLVTGEKLPEHKLPLVGRFYGDAESQSSQGNRFYENLRTLNGHQAEIEGRRKARESTSDYLAENPEARLYRQADYTQRQVSALQKRKRELVEKDAPRERVKEVEDRIAGVMTRFNERVKEARQQ